MKGKYERRALRRADHRTRADRLADQRKRDELRREIAAADAQASDLALLAARVHDRLGSLQQRDAAAAAELTAQAQELSQVAQDLQAENAERRRELRRVARTICQQAGSSSDHAMLPADVVAAVVELQGHRTKPPRDNLHRRWAIALGWPTRQARGAVQNSGAYHLDASGLR